MEAEEEERLLQELLIGEMWEATLDEFGFPRDTGLHEA